MARHGFWRDRHGSIRLSLDPAESAVLASLAEQLVGFVASPPPGPDEDPLVAIVGIDAAARRPEDPALARLLPDAHLEDEAAADEFRRFTERDLRELKAGHARTVLAALENGADPVARDDVPAWLGFLNDTRLTLGVRLGITDDSHEELASLPDDDPRAAVVPVYDWLTWLQDALVTLLLPDE
jgi:hypothetical protein